MSKCCDEYNCRRKNPILVRQTGLTGRWVVVTRYTASSHSPDIITASEKHDIDDDFTEYLKRLGWTPPSDV